MPDPDHATALRDFLTFLDGPGGRVYLEALEHAFVPGNTAAPIQQTTEYVRHSDQGILTAWLRMLGWWDALEECHRPAFWTPQMALALLGRLEARAHQEQADAEDHPTAVANPATREPKGPLTPRDLAALLGVPDEKFEAFRRRLERWRRQNPDAYGRGWREVAEPGPREPRYTFTAAAVRHLARGL